MTAVNKKNELSTASNKSKHNNKKGYNINTEDKQRIYVLPIIFILAILPLIVKIHPYDVNFSQYKWFPENDGYYDFFLYYKQIFLIITAAVMLVMLLYYNISKKEKTEFGKAFIPLMVYALLALLSTVFSHYRSYSLSGSYEQFESVFALLSYCIVAYYAYTIIKSEYHLKAIVYALLIGSIFMIIIGIFQLAGQDFYHTGFGWDLITGSKYKLEDFSFTAGISRVYLSLYNPNYVGFYVVLLFPIMLYMVIFLKNIWVKLAFVISIIGLLACLYGSKSAAGIVGIVVTVVITVALLWRYCIKYYFVTIPVIVLAIIGLFVFNSWSNNFIGNQINKIINVQKSTITIQGIETNDNNLTIKYKGNKLVTKFYKDDLGLYVFDFKDQNDEIVPSQFDTVNGPVTIMDERFAGFVFTPMLNGDVVGFDVNIGYSTWFFTNQLGDGTFYYYNNYGRYDKIVEAPSAVFTGYESLATGRGYIWSKTIPLLKDKILLGSGADTFALIYPQNDYVGMYNYGIPGQILTKPHCMYLQIAAQTGIISLLAFLAFYLIYFISSVRLYINCKYDNFFTIMGSAIFVSTVGYMVCAITNDSSITTAPIFWALIGTGLAINTKLKKLKTMKN